MLKFFTRLFAVIGVLVVGFVGYAFIEAAWRGYQEALLKANHSECRALATQPWLGSDRYPGVFDRDFNAAAAKPACETEVAEKPEDAELHYYLARANNALGDLEAFVQHLEKADELGLLSAKMDLAIEGRLQMSDAETILLVQEASTHGHFNARLALASLYFAGDGVEKSTEKFIETLGELAQDGSALGMMALAATWTQGTAGAADSKKFNYWVLQAANAGVAEAMPIAAMINRDQGNYDEAIRWYEKAANNGAVDAMKELVVLYSGARDYVPANTERKKHWINNIVEDLEWNQVQFIARDWEKTRRSLFLELMESAFLRGEGFAAIQIGKYHLSNRNVSEGVMWLEKAILTDSAEAQYAATKTIFDADLINVFVNAVGHMISTKKTRPLAEVHHLLLQKRGSAYWKLEQRIVNSISKSSDTSAINAVSTSTVHKLVRMSSEKEVYKHYEPNHVNFLYQSAVTLLTTSNGVSDSTRKTWADNKGNIDRVLSNSRYWSNISDDREKRYIVFQAKSRSGWRGQCGNAPSLPSGQATQNDANQFNGKYRTWDECVRTYVGELVDMTGKLAPPRIWQLTATGHVPRDVSGDRNKELVDEMLKGKEAREYMSKKIQEYNRRLGG